MDISAIMVGVIFITLSVVTVPYSVTSSGFCHFIHACKLSGEFHTYYHTLITIRVVRFFNCLPQSWLLLPLTYLGNLTLMSVDVYKCHWIWICHETGLILSIQRSERYTDLKIKNLKYSRVIWYAARLCVCEKISKLFLNMTYNK